MSALVRQSGSLLFQHSALTNKQRIAHIVNYKGAAKMMEQWLVLIDVILVPQDLQPTINKITMLFKTADKVSVRLCTHAQHKPGMSESLI